MSEASATAQPFRVVVFADFVCPYSFLAVDQIDRLAREYDVRPLWRPYWLHPETPPEGSPREKGADGAAKRARLEAWIKEMAPEQYPRIRFPEKRCYSFRELDAPFKTAVYDIMWTEGGDIGETDTLLAAAERSGLAPDELKRALDEGEYAERALDAVMQARQIGITNTPTIFLGRTRINGWHYYEVLQSVMEKQGMQPKVALAS